MLADPRDTIGRSLLVSGAWEPHVTAAFREVLRPGDAVADVGANLGYHALLAAHLAGEGGVVLAFEPEAQNRALLEEHVRRNAARTVRVLPLALGARGERRVLHRGPAWNPGAGSLRPVEGSAGEEAVEVVRGDAAIPRDLWRRLRLVKVDVEGAEAEVLAGLSGLFDAGHRPHLVLEVTDEFLRALGSGEEALLARLAALGYRCRRLSEPPARGLRQYDALFSV